MTITIKTAALGLVFLAGPALADPALTALPGPLEPRNHPLAWHATGADSLTISAGPKTDWFVAPWNPELASDSSPTLLFRPEGNFTLSAKIALQPKSRWDSGALVLFVDKNNWAKMNIENANGDGRLSVVMVVTRGVSDDSYTDFSAPENTLYLSISRSGPGFFVNASHDGKNWTMLRAFALNGDLASLKAGFLAQSPTGDGMTVTFSDIRYERGK